MFDKSNDNFKTPVISNYEEYSFHALKTAIYPNNGENIVYPVLGLVGETGELRSHFEGNDNSEIAEAVKKELGDILWYLNALCYEIGYEFEFMWIQAKPFEVQPVPIVAFSRLQMAEGRMCEIAKKAMRDNHGVLVQERELEMITLVNRCTSAIKTLIKMFGFNDLEIMQLNLDKLFDRMRRNAIHGEGDNR